jgi:hypothetical protein
MTPGKSMKQVGPTEYITATISPYAAGVIIPGLPDNAIIDWGDGTIENVVGNSAIHVYTPLGGTWNLKIFFLKKWVLGFNDDTTGFYLSGVRISSYNFRSLYNLYKLYLSDPTNGAIANEFLGPSVDISYLTSLKEFICNDAPNVTSISNLRNNPSLFNVNLINCVLSSTLVNNVLIQLDQNNLTDGTLLLAGSNAAPTGDGLTAKANLISKNWTVFTN